MNWFLKALSSTVGRKLVMAITGLLLCGFLVAHFLGNLNMLVGQDKFDQYAHLLHSQPQLLAVAEAGLVILFFAHIFLAYTTTRENLAARKITYAEKTTKQDGGVIIPALAPNNWMHISGIVVLLFIILHLVDLHFSGRPDLVYDEHSHYNNVLMILRNPISCTVYIIGTIALCWHLLHGVSSAFQTLGINHPKYNKLIKTVGVLFAIVFGLGFIIFPLWAIATQQ